MQADGFLKAGNQPRRDLVRAYGVSFAARELTRQAFEQAPRRPVKLDLVSYKSNLAFVNWSQASLPESTVNIVRHGIICILAALISAIGYLDSPKGHAVFVYCHASRAGPFCTRART
jgi:hypothetical protein